MDVLIAQWQARIDHLKVDRMFQHQVIKAKINAEIKGMQRCVRDLKKYEKKESGASR